MPFLQRESLLRFTALLDLMRSISVDVRFHVLILLFFGRPLFLLDVTRLGGFVLLLISGQHVHCRRHPVTDLSFTHALIQKILPFFCFVGDLDIFIVSVEVFRFVKDC